MIFWVAQAVWVTMLLMPAMAVNAIPATAFAALPAVMLTDVVGLGIFLGGFVTEIVADAQKTRWLKEKRAKVHDEEFITRGLFSRRYQIHSLPHATTYPTLPCFFWDQIAAGQRSDLLGSQFPNYFGEITLWTGLAAMAAGVLVRKPVQLALGLPGGILGAMVAVGLPSLSPWFTQYVLLNLSGVPLSERKYNKKYGDRKDYQEWKQNTPKLIPKLW